MLEFAPMKGNAKLAQYRNGFTFSLPAGHSCPCASACLSRADKETGKISDGARTEFRCFAASMEAIFSTLRARNWRNFEQLKGKTKSEIVSLIAHSIPAKAEIIRVHVGGDFFSQTYFDAWLDIGRIFPLIKFYAYTKSLNFWAKSLDSIPSNFILTASEGGKKDWLIKDNDLRFSRVVFSEGQASEAGLVLDHDDSLAMNNGPSFGLLIHGIQPAHSEASKAVRALAGIGSYRRKTSENKDGSKGAAKTRPSGARLARRRITTDCS